MGKVWFPNSSQATRWNNAAQRRENEREAREALHSLRLKVNAVMRRTTVPRFRVGSGGHGGWETETEIVDEPNHVRVGMVTYSEETSAKRQAWMDEAERALVAHRGLRVVRVGDYGLRVFPAEDAPTPAESHDAERRGVA